MPLVCIPHFVETIFPFKPADKSTIFRRVIFALIKERATSKIFTQARKLTRKGIEFPSYLIPLPFPSRRERSSTIAQSFSRVTHRRARGEGAAGLPLGKPRYFDARYFDSLSAAPTRGLHGIRNTLTTSVCIIDARALD